MRSIVILSVAASLSLAGCTDAETPGNEEAGEASMEPTVAAGPEGNETPGVAADIAAEPGAEVPVRQVRYGLDGPNFDACGSVGEVTGLKPDGDNFLSVRGAPSANAGELDRLPAGMSVTICESADGWAGIVYDLTGEMDCGTGTPVKSAQNYGGPCRSGWVSEKYIAGIAG